MDVNIDEASQDGQTAQIHGGNSVAANQNAVFRPRLNVRDQPRGGRDSDNALLQELKRVGIKEFSGEDLYDRFNLGIMGWPGGVHAGD